MINPHIFREYDIRGVAEADLTDEAAGRIARAFGSVVREGGGRTVVLGRDVRLSSPRLRSAWAAGLAGCGLEVWDIGVVPTPVVYYAVAEWGADAGVMITGSHNPIEYNGFKLQAGPASLHGEAIQSLRARAEAGRFQTGEGRIEERDAVAAYRRMVVDRCRPSRGLRIVIDAGNGTAGPLAVPLLSDLGHEVIALYAEPDGRFPNHLPDPTVPELMRDLCARVVSERADLGLGFDGDADRLGVVTERGELLFGDQLLALFAQDVLARRPGAPIVFDVKCSRGLEEEIVARGGRPVMWRSGHSLTKAKMRELDAPLAGELSGHIFFGDGFYGHDDGIYGGARFAALASARAGTVSAWAGSLPHYVNSPEIRVACADEAKFRVVAGAAREFARTRPVIDLDGARVSFDDGWGLVRASNTQPVLVLRFEGRSRGAIEEIEREFRRVLAAWPEVSWPPVRESG